MKGLLILFFWLCTASSLAQGVFSNETNTALQRVISDYPNKFENIKGDKLQSRESFTEYQSRVSIPGSTVRFYVVKDARKGESYAWTASLARDPEFETARRHFKELYNHIRNTIVRIEGLPPVILTGNYDEPLVDRNATAVLFQLLPGNGSLQQLKVELHLQKEGGQWVTQLRVFEKEALPSLAQQTP